MLPPIRMYIANTAQPERLSGVFFIISCCLRAWSVSRNLVAPGHFLSARKDLMRDSSLDRYIARSMQKI